MHRSVLLQEIIDTLNIKKGDVVVDATFGGGGHSIEFSKLLGKDGILIGFDMDSLAIEKGKHLFENCVHQTHLRVSNFKDLDRELANLGIKGADKYLFDLGFSSIQLEEGGRGLSFQKDEPLLMTLSNVISKNTLTAERIVNEWSVEQIETIIKSYGEEGFARKIAQAIVKKREEIKITTTKQLADIIYHAVPVWYRKKRIHPATKTFQAFRIAVNDEIENLKIGLGKALLHLKYGGYIAVISFHSIEDRIVKRLFREWKKEGKGEIITKKPITPQQAEVIKNPRSRSAKLRVFKKHVTSNLK